MSALLPKKWVAVWIYTTQQVQWLLKEGRKWFVAYWKLTLQQTPQELLFKSGAQAKSTEAVLFLGLSSQALLCALSQLCIAVWNLLRMEKLSFFLIAHMDYYQAALLKQVTFVGYLDLSHEKVKLSWLLDFCLFLYRKRHIVTFTYWDKNNGENYLRYLEDLLTEYRRSEGKNVENLNSKGSRPEPSLSPSYTLAHFRFPFVS